MSFDNISRREFLKIGVATSLAGISDLGFAQVQKKSNGGLMAPQMSHPFIVVFLRGGADGLAILSPLNDENFIAARPPEMRFAIDASSGRVETANVSLYWHPEASPLAGLFSERKLMVWTNSSS